MKQANSLSLFALGFAVAVLLFRSFNQPRVVLIQREDTQVNPAFWLNHLLTTPALPAKCEARKYQYVIDIEPLPEFDVYSADMLNDDTLARIEATIATLEYARSLLHV